MLGARTCSQTDKFFTSGRYEGFDVYYISQCYFDLPGQRLRSNSDILILFKQTLRDVQSMYKDIGRYDRAYCDIKKNVP